MNAILTPAELASIRRPYRAARLLPARTYHDPAIFEFEVREWFRRDWILVGRLADVADPGAYLVADVGGESIIVVRGRDHELRGFFNVCRHRGTPVIEEPRGTAVRFQCPYHAWIYDLDGRLIRARHTDDLVDFALAESGLVGVRVETWQGFVFVSLDPSTPALIPWLDDLVSHLARFDFGALRSAHRIEYDVAANWKFIAENYSECYHCPGVHPHLNRLTPYDIGADFETTGPWQGGWMELAGEAETMALGGGHRGNRPALPGMTAIDERRIVYYVLWPAAFVSVHPDYLLVHRLIPGGPDRTHVVCDWLFEPSTMEAPDFDPHDAVEFWDLTNRQDWHVCELQQRGTRSMSWVAGRYSSLEASVHAFDLMVADRYVGDGARSRRTVRARYDIPPPDDDERESTTHQTGDGSTTAARRSARVGARSRASRR